MGFSAAGSCVATALAAAQLDAPSLRPPSMSIAKVGLYYPSIAVTGTEAAPSLTVEWTCSNVPFSDCTTNLPAAYTFAYEPVSCPGEAVEPADVLYVVSWGFGVIVFLWFLGYCIGAGLKVIRKV